MPTDQAESPGIFLQELKDQLQRYIGIKNGLDAKANSLIVTAGTISIIFIGFGTLGMAVVGLDGSMIVLLGLVMIFEVLITLWAIQSAMNAYKAREYLQPIVYDELFDDEKVRDETIRLFAYSDPVILREHFMQEYALSIKSYQEQNDMQVSDIERAEKIFRVALGSILAFAVFVVVGALMSWTYIRF